MISKLMALISFLMLFTICYWGYRIHESECEFRKNTSSKELELQGEINRLKMENSILNRSYDLAKDEIREWSNKRTYEEGLTDGLVRSGTTGYRDGYHAAMAQVEETKARLEEIKQYEAKKDPELPALSLQKPEGK